MIYKKMFVCACVFVYISHEKPNWGFLFIYIVLIYLTDRKRLVVFANFVSPRSQAQYITGAPNDGFLPNALKRCFRQSGLLLKLCRLILGCAIKFLSVRFF